MNTVVKAFNELSVDELHDIYSLRAAVFVVEQNCVYQDIDKDDKTAFHIWFSDDEGIQAYCRVLDKNNRFGEVSIGRVIAVKRRCGYGTKIVEQAINTAQEKFNAEKIIIEAQTYAKKLYENLGFVQISDEFLEDGIPHVKMMWEK